jgi:hypothetical protein
VKPNADSRWRRDDDTGESLMPMKQSEFLDWLLSDIKSPPSQAQWAMANDVNERTVQTWKKDPRFVAEWEKRAADKNISPERIQDMVDTLYQAGKNGDIKAAKDYIDYVSRFLPPPELRTNDKGIQGMSDEELDAAISALMDE